MSDETDDALVVKAQGGDNDAFGVLVRRHHALVAGLCASLLENASEADDAAQEVFLKAHRGLASFGGDSKFTTWLHRIAVNNCLDRRRAAARRRSVPLEAALELAAPKPAVSEEDSDLARRLLASLSEDYRAILLFREGQGFTYQEIAEAMDCTVDSVKARLRRARAELRHFYAGSDVQSSGG